MLPLAPGVVRLERWTWVAGSTRPRAYQTAGTSGSMAIWAGLPGNGRRFVVQRCQLWTDLWSCSDVVGCKLGCGHLRATAPAASLAPSRHQIDIRSTRRLNTRKHRLDHGLPLLSAGNLTGSCTPFQHARTFTQNQGGVGGLPSALLRCHCSPYESAEWPVLGQHIETSHDRP